MNELLQNLIEALREELKQYGEMLALLEQQQQLLVVSRHGTELLKTIGDVEEQTQTIRVARSEREQRFRDLARTLALGSVAGFKELLPCLPAAYRPLVQALVEENNQLLQRIQKRARENHLLLSRAVDLMQQLIKSLIPSAESPACAEPGFLPATASTSTGYNEMG